MTLEEIRGQLDLVDRELIALFEKRMTLSEEVARIKWEKKLPIFQPERERQVLDSRVALLEDPTLEDAARSLMQLMMDLGKQRQSRVLEALNEGEDRET